jgi:molybdate transport system substrate-binding protein
MRFVLWLAACLVAIGATLAGPPRAAAADRLVVFAAASLATALEDAAAAWTAETGVETALSFAGSSALARQIAQGAPADLFLSANVAWMDRLEADGLIRPGTWRALVGNALVLVAHGAPPALAIAPGFDLAGALGDGRLAMALVDAVPAGIYGRQALEALGVWEAVAPRVAEADNVRAALALVARGEAPLGIVYATDAVAEPGVSVVGTFPADSHDPIVYPAAVTAESTHPEADAFLAFLASDAARPFFARQGFTALD